MIPLLIALLLQVVYPFECLPELGLDDLEARNIWMGYDSPTPWDIPDDAVLAYLYNREWIDTFEVYYSESANEYYVRVYDTEPVWEEAYDGKWRWSWHPCGQGAITPEQYEYVIGDN